MKVIGLLNEKGGSGKSTWAVTLASGLAARGHTVVLMDADPQGDSTLAFGFQRESGFHDLMASNADWGAILKTVDPLRWAPSESPSGELFLVPGSKDTQNLLYMHNNTRLLQRLQQLAQTGVVDYVIIDANPSPNKLHTFICLAADAIVTPAMMAIFDIVGTVDTSASIEETAHERGLIGQPPLEIIGIIPTKVRMRTQLHNVNLEHMRNHYGDKVWAPAPLSVVWEEAAQERMSIYAYGQSEDLIRVAETNVDFLEEAMNGR